MQNATEEKTFTAASPRRLLSIWRKASVSGYVLECRTRRRQDYSPFASTTADPTRVSIFFRFGCPR